MATTKMDSYDIGYRNGLASQVGRIAELEQQLAEAMDIARRQQAVNDAAVSVAAELKQQVATLRGALLALHDLMIDEGYNNPVMESARAALAATGATE